MMHLFSRPFSSSRIVPDGRWLVAGSQHGTNIRKMLGGATECCGLEGMSTLGTGGRKPATASGAPLKRRRGHNRKQKPQAERPLFSLIFPSE